jgi:hypothetical protein
VAASAHSTESFRGDVLPGVFPTYMSPLLANGTKLFTHLRCTIIARAKRGDTVSLRYARNANFSNFAGIQKYFCEKYGIKGAEIQILQTENKDLPLT